MNPPFWTPLRAAAMRTGQEIQEFVIAVFKRQIQNGCNLIGVEDICSSYDTTFPRYRNSSRSSGEMMYDLWLTDYQVTPWDLKVELVLNHRLRIDHEALKEEKGIVIVKGSYVGAMIVDPPPDLRRVSLRLIGAEIVVPRDAKVRT